MNQKNRILKFYEDKIHVFEMRHVKGKPERIFTRHCYKCGNVIYPNKDLFEIYHRNKYTDTFSAFIVCAKCGKRLIQEAGMDYDWFKRYFW